MCLEQRKYTDEVIAEMQRIAAVTERYTAATIAEMQRITAFAELRKWIDEKTAAISPDQFSGTYERILLNEFREKINEVQPICDNLPE